MPDQQPSHEMIEQALLTAFRQGRPVLVGFECLDCGELMWARVTHDGIHQATDEELPKPHTGRQEGGDLIEEWERYTGRDKKPDEE